MRTGSIMWAHSFERLWFEVLDGRVAKVPRYVRHRQYSNPAHCRSWCRMPLELPTGIRRSQAVPPMKGVLDVSRLQGECLYGTTEELAERRRR